MTGKHARAFDLPGWPCPPRVRDIPTHEDTWGWVPVSAHTANGIAIDELGYLWANGDLAPRFREPNEEDANPGAVLAWTPDGLGVWVHPKSMAFLPQVSRLDMTPDSWLPIAQVLTESPATSGNTTVGA